ncbi:hypothetical protein FNL37_0543 [Methylovorus glucosotrophus]|uniref:hypothetical protein n=1 Tax=Methylovorus glucosotrophus TaxID=266009 RepID=UPI00133183E2|nr:hypothetical protein [Methylovorus glucosotrophus]KAF0843126.1 hypothetical protein FNL37_0543 [Methylovorus glucosotrophus]
MSIVKLAKFDSGFELLARETLQDSRLSLSALGGLVRMLSLPNDWEIRIGPLEREILHVGPDLRKRLFKELIDAGYIKRSQSRNLNGTWDWNFTVFPTSALKANEPNEGESFQEDHKSTGGEAMDGKAIDGSSIDEKSPDIDITNPLNTEFIKLPLQQATKPTSLSELEFFYSFPEAIRSQALLMLNGLDLELAQLLLDELSGIALRKRIKVTPISVLKGLLNSYHQGKFTPNLALEVQSKREQRIAEQAQSKQNLKKKPSTEARYEPRREEREAMRAALRRDAK